MATAKDVGKAISTIPARIGPTAGGALRRLLDLAIDGYEPLPSAKATAAKHLARKAEVDAAIDALVNTHIALASAQGFVTNLGGILASLVTMPANITGVAIVQARLVACIAHLRGYDITDGRVRTAMVMCLLGEDDLAKLIRSGRLPTSPLAVATAPRFDAALDARVSELVMGELVTGVGGKRLTTFVVRKIPLVGGGVGAVFDGYATHQIGQCAKNQLVSRRAVGGR